MITSNDFKLQWEEIRDDALSAVARVGKSGWLILGDEVDAFEADLAAWWGVRHAVGVASGLDALEIALRCVGITQGTRVVTTPLTAFATTIAIVRIGAEPIWCDVDDSGGLDLNQVETALRTDSSIRAVVPVHLYGHPLDPTHLSDLSSRYDVQIIEDCAQAAGAARNGQTTGQAGPVAATSLYPTKNLGAMGDGGVVLTSDPGIAARARCLRDYGQSTRYRHVELGLNSRLDELHAAILRSALLPRLDGWLRRRREIADRYTDALTGSSLRPILATGGSSAHHLYPVEATTATPDQLIVRLARRGIHVARHYPFLCPEQPAVRDIGRSIGPLSTAHRISSRELSLPIHPHLTDDAVDLVIESCLATQ